MRKVAAALLLLVTMTGCAPKAASVDLLVSAAASMTDALKELQPAFEAEHRDIRLRFNFGSSGGLQQQIESGAPADLFISAAVGPVDALQKKGLLQSVQTLAANKVVLIRPASAAAGIQSWSDLQGPAVQRVALGNPAHVPAGQYGKAVLESLKLYEAVSTKLVLGEDVRQVLHFVESGEAQAGIVYSTDAAAAPKVVVVAEAPPGSHQPVTYPVAVIKGTKHTKEAAAFVDFLLAPSARAVLKKYGFSEAAP